MPAHGGRSPALLTLQGAWYGRSMSVALYVLGSRRPRPTSAGTIFADGSADETFRERIDLELSHWLPNRTPPEFKADTSTEICMRFVASSPHGSSDLAINNHLDVDGVLSVFTLVHPALALSHRDVIVATARMGDFWDWGERPAQILFQRLTSFQRQVDRESTDLQDIYEACFALVREVLTTGTVPDEAGAGLAALAASDRRVETGEIARTVLSERFVHFALPARFAEEDLERALHVPAFNVPLSNRAWLLPQTRNRHDRERIQLVSVARGGGWSYDLWYPGYRWADTPNSWAAPGFSFSGSTNGYYYGHPPLAAAVDALRADERGPGKWVLATELSPFATIPGRNYPVVLSFVDEAGRPSTSTLPPEDVARRLAAAFAG